MTKSREARERQRAKNRAARARTTRRSRAKPKTGWSIRELAALTGATVRMVRLYLERGVLPAPTFAASATRYGRHHLLALIAIRRLLTHDSLELGAIKTRLAAWKAAELEAYATADIPAGPLASALGITPTAALPPVAGDLHLSALNFAQAAAMATIAERRWTRVELALGLEIQLRDDASPRVVALAQLLLEISRQEEAGGAR